MSTTSSLAPISIASIIIGFISFTFTLAIWLHAFWDAFVTLGKAPQQVQDALSVLRQGLYEEREYLKRTRRRSQSHSGKAKSLYLEGGPQRVINDAVKDLIRDFKDLERPFLENLHEGREKELEWSFDATKHYYKCDLHHRILWLRTKSGINDIAIRLGRLQSRRIAEEVTDMRFMVRDMMGMVRESEDRLHAIEDRLRMSRIG